MLISALSLQATDLRSPNLHRGASDRGATAAWDLTYFSRSKLVKMDKQHFGTTTVAQIVTGVHRDL